MDLEAAAARGELVVSPRARRPAVDQACSISTGGGTGFARRRRGSTPTTPWLVANQSRPSRARQAAGCRARRAAHLAPPIARSRTRPRRRARGAPRSTSSSAACETRTIPRLVPIHSYPGRRSAPGTAHRAAAPRRRRTRAGRRPAGAEPGAGRRTTASSSAALPHAACRRARAPPRGDGRAGAARATVPRPPAVVTHRTPASSACMPRTWRVRSPGSAVTAWVARRSRASPSPAPSHSVPCAIGVQRAHGRREQRGGLDAPVAPAHEAPVGADPQLAAGPGYTA